MTTEEVLKIFDLKPIDGQMILIGVVVFFIFWRIVDKLIFNPFLALYEEREALMDGAREASQHLMEQAHAIHAKCDEAIHKARLDAVSDRLKGLNLAKAQAAKLGEEAESEIQEMVRKARWEREQNSTQTRQRILSDAEDLAREVVQKLTLSSASH